MKAQAGRADISQKLIAQFHDDGYCVVRGLYNQQEVQSVRGRLEELWEGRHSYPWPHDHLGSANPQDRNTPGGNYRSGNMQLPASLEGVFHDFAFNPKLLSAMEALLGAPVRHFTDQTIFKAGALKTERSFYHQDSFYWRLRPRVCINCWVALDEVDRDAIALAFLPGSHRRWRIRYHEEYWDDVRYARGKDGTQYMRRRIPLDAVDESVEVLTPGKPGDAFFFNNFTWHRAEPNRSGLNKAAYAIAFQLDRPDNRLSEQELGAITDDAPVR